MPDGKTTNPAARETRNEGLEKSDERLHDPEQRTPHQVVDHEAGAGAAQNVPDNANEQDPARLENPPQVIGPRERNNDAV
jgi:hypothetical protein